MSEEENSLQTRARSYSKSEKMASGKQQEGKKGNNSEPEAENSQGENKSKELLSPFKPDQQKPVSENDWWEMFKKIGLALNGVQSELMQMKNLKEKIDTHTNSYTENWKTEIEDKMQILELCDSDKDFQLKLLTNVVVRQQEKIDELESRLNRVQQKETRANVVISGLEEDKGESHDKLLKKAKEFIKEKLEIQEDVKLADVYRKGKRGLQDRQVVMRLSKQSDKAKIFANASNLKEKVNKRKKFYFIRDDGNDAQEQTRMYYRDLVKENKLLETDKQQTIKMFRGSIMINNQKVVNPLQVPKIGTLLKANAQQMELILATKVIECEEHFEEGSEFYCYVQKVRTVNDVENGLKKLKVKFADATHISLGFRLKSPLLQVDQGYIDDGEGGQGRNILNTLKNDHATEICVYMVRYYGGVHLGKRRFAIAKDLTLAAVKTLKVTRNMRAQRLKKSESQTSLLSDFSMGSTEDLDLTTQETEAAEATTTETREGQEIPL